MRFENQTVLITGAAGGIGKSTALAFADEGANLIIVDRQQACIETAEICRQKGVKAEALILDVTDKNAPDQMVNKAIEVFGRLDIAFNNVGIAGVNVDITEYPNDEWDQVMNVNVGSIFRAMKAQINHMRKNKSGSIVNTASVASLTAIQHSSAYIAAKHALMGLTKAAALDVIQDGIRINAICPGIIDTPLLEHGKKIPGFVESLEASVPCGRLGQAEEIAKSVLFLASKDASYMFGQGMVIDGGVTLL